MSKIDDFLHEVDCYDSQFYRENGGEQAAADLAQLRLALKFPLKIFLAIKDIGKMMGIDYQNIDKWIELHAKETL